MPLLILGRPRKEALERATVLLAEVGLGDHVNNYPTQISGGQQHRVAIARALVHQPRLLVCDEPTSALDAETGQKVMQLMREVAVRPGRAVVVVTHDSRTYSFANRIVSMSDGQIES